MPAYFIVDIDLKELDRMQEYREPVPGFVMKGNRQPKRVVVLEVPSVEQAKRWYESDDDRERKNQRQAASSSNMILVEGTPA